MRPGRVAQAMQRIPTVLPAASEDDWVVLRRYVEELERRLATKDERWK